MPIMASTKSAQEMSLSGSYWPSSSNHKPVIAQRTISSRAARGNFSTHNRMAAYLLGIGDPAIGGVLIETSAHGRTRQTAGTKTPGHC
jgi:hypothetical protein